VDILSLCDVMAVYSVVMQVCLHTDVPGVCVCRVWLGHMRRPLCIYCCVFILLSSRWVYQWVCYLFVYVNKKKKKQWKYQLKSMFTVLCPF